MLQPKRTKYRKQFKGHNGGLAMRGNTVAFGDFGLKATDRARMTAREIEAARRAMARRAASISRAVMRARSVALRPKSPKATVLPRIARPPLWPLNCLRYLVRLGCSMLAYSGSGFRCRRHRRGHRGSGSGRSSCRGIGGLALRLVLGLAIKLRLVEYLALEDP